MHCAASAGRQQIVKTTQQLEHCGAITCSVQSTAPHNQWVSRAQDHSSTPHCKRTTCKGQRCHLTMKNMTKPFSEGELVETSRMAPSSMSEAVVTEPHLRPMRSPMKPSVTIPKMMPTIWM